MGRKKKETAVVKTPKEEVKQPAVEITSPSIKYTGEVTIKYTSPKGTRRTLKRHNEGKIGLFTSITRALAGYDIALYMPSLLMAYGTGDVQLLTQKIGYASTPATFMTTASNGNTSEIQTDATSNDIVQYTFVIAVNNIADRADTIQKLKLFNTIGMECATVTLGSAISTNISSNIIVYWKLKFTSV